MSDENVDATNSTQFCKRCKSKVVKGYKCVLCESYFHNSCAKRLNNINILDENTLKCCENDELPDDNDKEFFEALSENSTTGNSIDIRIFKYIIHQKNSVICELKDRINELRQHIAYLTSQPLINKPNVLPINNKSESASISSRLSCDVNTVQVNKVNNNEVEVSEIEDDNSVIAINNENVNLDKNDSGTAIPRQEMWSKVVSRRKIKRDVVVGKNDNITEKN